MDLFGICISEGYAAGNACMYQKPTSVGSGIFAGVQEELQRFDTAKRLAKQQLLEALRRLSDNQAASELIQVQEMLLDDTEFSQAVRDQIDSGHCAGQAVTQAAASLADFFRAMDDSYMAARASDFLDIANRLLDCMAWKTLARRFPWSAPAFWLRKNSCRVKRFLLIVQSCWGS